MTRKQRREGAVAVPFRKSPGDGAHLGLVFHLTIVNERLDGRRVDFGEHHLPPILLRGFAQSGFEWPNARRRGNSRVIAQKSQHRNSDESLASHASIIMELPDGFRASGFVLRDATLGKLRRPISVLLVLRQKRVSRASRATPEWPGAACDALVQPCRNLESIVLIGLLFRDFLRKEIPDRSPRRPGEAEARGKP